MNENQEGQTNELHQAAIDLKSKGISVVPVNQNKAPALRSWKRYQGEPMDNGELWQHFVEKKPYGIGIITGKVSGAHGASLLVLDFDVQSAFDEWSAAHPELANTVQVQTGKGVHLYYQVHEAHGLTTQPFSVNGEHVGEIRCEGGMVVVPPTKHPSGQGYDWTGSGKIRHIDSWGDLGLTLGKPKAGRRNDTIPEGQRNTELTSIAGTLRYNGASETELATELAEINQARCDPPLDIKEVGTIAHNIGKKPLPQMPINLTDTGNTERLRRLYADKLCYVYALDTWLRYTGHYWRRVTEGVMLRATKGIAHRMAKEASLEGDKDLARWATASEGRARRAAIVFLAQSELEGDIELFDTHDWLLNCLNGTLDLRNGELLPHHRGDMISKLARVAYKPDAGCPRWQQFLSEITGGDQQLVHYLQQLAGVWLTGDTSEHMLALLWGSGANGKTTYVEALRRVLGADYTQTIPVKVLLDRDRGGDAPQPSLVQLKGKRLVVTSESGPGSRLNEGLVKILTGGDTLSARGLHQAPIQWTPTHHLCMHTNHKPTIYDTTSSTWRRVKLIPFAVQFSEDQQDKQLLDKLALEVEGILAWAVEGCLDWQRNGLQQPDVVTAATKSYRQEMDTLGDWLADCCLLDKKAGAPFADLYESYRTYSGDDDMSKTRFGRSLQEKGFQKYRMSAQYKRTVTYAGIGLLDHHADTEGDEADQGQ